MFLSYKPNTSCAVCSDGNTNPSTAGDILAIDRALFIALSANSMSTK